MMSDLKRFDWDFSESSPPSPLTDWTGPGFAANKWNLAIIPETRSVRVIRQGEHVLSVFTNQAFLVGSDNRVLSLRLWSRSSEADSSSSSSTTTCSPHQIRMKVGIRIETRLTKHRLPTCSYFKSIAHNGACIACSAYGTQFHHYAIGDADGAMEFEDGDVIRVRVRGTRVAFNAARWSRRLQEIDIADTWGDELRTAREENGSPGVFYRFFVCFPYCEGGEVQIVSLEEEEEEESVVESVS